MPSAISHENKECAVSYSSFKTEANSGETSHEKIKYEGSLHKMSPNPIHHTFQKRYARLDIDAFRYYKSQKDREEQGAIPLLAMEAIMRSTEAEECVHFDIVVPALTDEKEARIYHFRAKDALSCHLD